MKKIFMSGMVVFTTLSAAAQAGSCTVLAEALKGTYTGECRGGLAHGTGTAQGRDKYEGQFKKGLPEGTGTYTWQSGDYFTGSWKKGLQEGKGAMHYGGSDSLVKSGYWKKGVYKGEYESPWVIHRLPNVLSKTIMKIDTSRNTVIIKVEQGVNGKGDVSNFTLLGGNYSRYDTRIQDVRGEIEFQQVIFPFRVRFVSEGDFVDVEFFEKGNWEFFIKY